MTVMLASEASISPLNLEAGVGLLSNTALKLGTDLTANIAAYEATPTVTKLLAIQALAATSSLTSGTKLALQQMGAATCPALGDSVPTAYQNTNYPIPPTGGTPKLIPSAAASLFSGIIENIGYTYIGSGDTGKFAQSYFTSQGYISLVNPFIFSAVNANTTKYLGPTFTNMDNLITGDLAQANLAFPEFGQDFEALGVMINLANLDNIGNPGALLQQLSIVGNMSGGTLPAIRDALLAVGLTPEDITNLITNNVESLFNPTGITVPEYNALQKKSYPALCTIQNTDLTDVLTILQVTTPNITQMCQLLNPVKILPISYPSLTLPTPDGIKLVYLSDGTINPVLDPIVNSGALAPVGCDELSKIVPQANAVGSKALQIALQQVQNISSMTLPDLAAALL
jgi:hypothetical protein